MATLYSDLFPSRTAEAVQLSKRLEGFRTTPRTSFTQIPFTVAGTEASGDIVRLWKAPAGTIILPHLCVVQAQVDVATTAFTVDIGDEDVAGVGAAAVVNRYTASLALAAPGAYAFGSAAAAGLIWYRLGADAYITCKLTTVTLPLAGGKLVFGICYIGA